MDSKKKVEQIQEAIKRLMEEDKKRKKKSSSSSSDESSFEAIDCDEGDHRHHLLSNLLSQLESLKCDDKLEHSEPSADLLKLSNTDVGKVEPKSETDNEVDFGTSDGKEEIVKELQKVKRQNFITHCLLSTMIVLTVAWQLSEVSLILKVKDGFSHPFRSLGSMISGMLRGPFVNGQEDEKQSSEKQKHVAAVSLPTLKVPELPHVDFPVFDVNVDEE